MALVALVLLGAVAILVLMIGRKKRSVGGAGQIGREEQSGQSEIQIIRSIARQTVQAGAAAAQIQRPTVEVSKPRVRLVEEGALI